MLLKQLAPSNGGKAARIMDTSTHAHLKGRHSILDFPLGIVVLARKYLAVLTERAAVE